MLEFEWDKDKQQHQAYLGIQEVLQKWIVGAIDPEFLRECYNEIFAAYCKNPNWSSQE